VKQARARRIDAVLLSEHEETGWTPARYSKYVLQCRAASTRGVQLIPGIEFSQDGFHVLCYGLQHFPPRPSTAAQLAAAVHAQGCRLCLAHPAKYRWRHPAELVAAADAVEVWNSKWIYDGTCGPHPQSLRLAAGKQWLVGQDVHKAKHFAPLYLQTEGPEIMADLATGRYQIVYAEIASSPAQLGARPFWQALQLGRTETLKAALVTYRLLRGKQPFPHRRLRQSTVSC
jgi:hypothetical protein